MANMVKMANKRKAATGEVSVAAAKNHLSELLGRVAYRGETVLITRRGKPLAKLVPLDFIEEGKGLADVKGWMDDQDPFLGAVEDIIEARSRHFPRALKRKHPGR